MQPTSRRPATAGRPQPRRRRGRRPVPGRRPIRLSTRILGGAAVLVITVSGVGHAAVAGVSGAIGRVDAFGGMQGRPGGSMGTNFLLVGTDGRDDLAPGQKQAYHLGGAPCHCTDTIMLVHLSQDRSRASVVSIPRDTYVRLPAPVPARSPSPAAGRKGGGHGRAPDAVPGATRPAKLNQAYAQGGPKLTVRTVEQLTGVHVDHYLEVDFTSFMKTVDVLGGVPVCTSKPLKDPYSGLDLPAGTTVLNGGQALQYVRSRHVDPAADLGRMQRQQRFMAALIERATSSGILLNPMRFRDVTRAVLGSVRADKGFGTGELLDLGRAMRNFSPSSSEFTTVPIRQMAYAVKGIGSTVKWDSEKADRLFSALREDQPLAPHRTRNKVVRVEVAPQEIHVQVENGTKTEGLAKRVDEALAATGFRTTGRPLPATDRTEPRTVVAHDPRWDRSAKSLAAALPGSVLRPVKGLGPTLKVIVGEDFRQVRKVRSADPTQGESYVVRGDEAGCS